MYLCFTYVQNWTQPMPRPVVDDHERMSLRAKPEVKARLNRAAALRGSGLSEFVLQAALREADAVLEAAEHAKLSERDSLKVLELLENPREPNTRLRAAIAALPKA